MWVYAFINVPANCLIKLTACNCVYMSIYHRLRAERSEERWGKDAGNKDRTAAATDGPMFWANFFKNKKKVKKLREDRGEISGRSKEEKRRGAKKGSKGKVSGKEEDEKIWSSKGICPTLVSLMRQSVPNLSWITRGLLDHPLLRKHESVGFLLSVSMSYYWLILLMCCALWH